MIRSLILLLLLAYGQSLLAKEGMWIPYLIGQLNHNEMTEMGLQISAEDIYSVNNSSIKDAIVHFGGGCTAEIISGQGLLLTNHHCGYSRIQSHSSVEKNYLKEGYWAMSPHEELKNPGLTASIVKFMEDVTNQILENVPQDIDAEDRQKAISENIQNILKERQLASEYELEIVPFYYGNQYILIGKEVFKDVRLVGAPPSSIGKFGADTDNWMWPRHTGDFALFRIYAGPDNKPADPSDENLPYHPNYSLPINISGVDTGDFSMIYGFPGRTMQYLPSNEVKNIIEVYDPARIAIREKLLAILDKKMRESEETRIQYASKYASISNAWKKWIGEINGLMATNAVEKKRKLEGRATQAISEMEGQEELQQAYSVLPQLKALYEERKPAMLQRYFYIEAGYYGIEMNRHLLRYRGLVEAYNKDDEERASEIGQQLLDGHNAFYKDYDAELDRQAMHAMLPVYLDAMSDEQLPELLQELKEMDDEDLREYINELYDDNPLLDDRLEFTDWLGDNAEKAGKKLAKSDAFQLSNAMYGHFLNVLNPQVDEINSQIEQLQAKYVHALQQLFPEERFYPDANSTLRITYGKVHGYEPKNGVKYLHQTYLEGVMEKYVPGDYEFDVPEKLIRLYEDKDYGPYGGEDGRMPVCFIASNHTTGGNSGSPALNGRGELVGLNFDRTWEGTMSDIHYDINRCRNIMVDARYILFIIDKFAGAGYLIQEMDIIDEPINGNEEEASNERVQEREPELSEN